MFYSSLSGMGLASTKGQAAYDVDEARADASEAKSEADVLKHDIDRLMMISEALWAFLKKEHGYADEDLAKARSAQIDKVSSGSGQGRTGRNVRLAAGWCRRIADFALPAAIRFRKACSRLEVIAGGFRYSEN